MGDNMYNVNSFKWSEEEYSLKDLLERFGHQLPFLISVTQGYCGHDERTMAIPANEVSWIYGIARQPRVVFKDDQERFFSVPESYQGAVIPTTKLGREGCEMRVRDLLTTGHIRHVKFATSRAAVFEGANHGNIVQMGNMELVDTYDERFLVVHVLSEGELYPEFILIPIYVPIQVTIAMAASNGGPRTFFTSMLDLKESADFFCHDYTTALDTFSQITKFEEKPDMGDYDYISVLPISMIKKNTKSSARKEIQQPTFRNTPVAFGINPEDRLRQLKHVLYNKNIPEDDAHEGLPLPAKAEAEARTKVKKVKGFVQNLAKKIKLPRTSKPSSNVPEGANRLEEPDQQYQSLVPQPSLQFRSSQKPEVAPKPPPSILNMEKGGTISSKPVPKLPSSVPTTHKSCTIGSAHARKLPSSTGCTIRNMQDIPGDITSLTVNDVVACLELLNLDRYTDVLRDHQIDGMMLTCLDEHQLQENEFGFTQFDARKLVMFATKCYRPKME